MRRVLVVEDNEMLAKLARQMIDEAPDLDFRRGPTDVNELMNDDAWRDVDVALIDLLLPGTAGDELLAWLASNVPHVRRIAMSGAGEDRLSHAGGHPDVLLLKPFMIDELLAAIRGDE